MLTKINKNFIYNFIYEIVIVLSPLIMVPYISRIIGPDLVGVRSYTFTILSFFELFASLGVTIYGQREIAKVSSDIDKRSKIFFELLFIKFISFSLCLMLYCISFFALNLLNEYKIIFLIWIIHFFEVAFNIVWYFQGMEKFKTIAIRGTLLRILQIIFTFLFIKEKSDFYLYILFYALFPFLQTISLWPFLLKSINFKMIKKVELRQHIKNIIVFFIPTIATTLYSSIDKVMLGTLSTTVETGYYESAFHIITLATSIFNSFYTVMRSRMSSTIIKYNEKDCDKEITNFIKIGFMIFLPTALGIFAISSCFTIVFFGNDYIPVINLLKEFSPILIIIGLSSLISSIYIIPFEKQKYLVIFYLIALCLNAISNSILIPIYKSYGAVIGSIISELSVLIGCIIISRKKIKFSKYFISSYKFIISAIFMSICVTIVDYYFKESMLWLGLEILIGIIIYFLGLIILKEELVLSIFRKKNRK